MDNRPISEIRAEVGYRWAKAHAAASRLEEGKSAFLEKRKLVLGDIPNNRAEMLVKASPEWSDYIKAMVDAKELANTLRIEMEYWDMKFSEWQSAAADNRVTARL